jgi:hypothetical protein
MALLEHALPILLRPKSEWSAISVKPMTPCEVYLGYVVPLNAIGPVADTVGSVEYILTRSLSDIAENDRFGGMKSYRPNRDR